MKHYIGIDECGRGCSVGPMVMSLVNTTEENRNQLIELGVKDSKTYKGKNKSVEMWNLSAEIRNTFLTSTVFASPNEIDSAVYCIPGHPEFDTLNGLERKMAIDLLWDISAQAIPRKNEDVTVYLDGKLIFRNIEKYLPWKNCNLIIEDKADQKYPEVAAASIVAKVHREYVINSIINDGTRSTLTKGGGYCNKHTEEWIRSWYPEYIAYIKGQKEYMPWQYKTLRQSYKWTEKLLTRLNKELG